MYVHARTMNSQTCCYGNSKKPEVGCGVEKLSRISDSLEEAHSENAWLVSYLLCYNINNYCGHHWAKKMCRRPYFRGICMYCDLRNCPD